MLRDFAACLTAVLTPQARISKRQFLAFNCVYWVLLLPLTTMIGLRNLNLLKKAGVETYDLFAPEHLYSLIIVVFVTVVPYLIVSAVHLINFRQRLKSVGHGTVLPTIALSSGYALLFVPYLAKLNLRPMERLLDDTGSLALIFLVLDLAAILWAVRQALKTDAPSAALPPKAP